MKKLALTVLASTAFATLAGGQAAAQFKERTIKLSAAVPQDHPFGAGAAALAACVTEKSGGKLKIQSFWNAQLGSDQQAVQAVRSGTLDIVVASTSPLVGLVPQLGAFDLPFLFANEKEADAVLDGPVGQKISERLLGVGLVNLSYWENGFRNMTNSRHPIQKWEDLQGLKVRVMQNNVFLDTFSNMGANAVPLAYGELYTALETKAIDGQENPYANIYSAKFYEAQKFLSITQHAYTPAVVMYSKRLWDQLSKDEQATLTSCATVSQGKERQANREQANEALAKLKELGMTINEVAPGELKRMREKANAVYQKHAASIGGETLDAVQAQLKQLRAAN
ncbi:TRAP transporter substrate-binding protein [Bosea sp. 2RAB26]|uniref:TRAP transporter substrate-binding protein n=1 Tax=Bosea sp. 2RAB26 TaxID=3237476 RepID=UPI003F90D01A